MPDCKGHALTVLLTNHALPRHPVETEQVRVRLINAPERCFAYAERIDETHANPKRAWREMGAPEYLSAEQVGRLEEASRMRKEPYPCIYKGGALIFSITLPPQAVAAVTVELAREQANEGASA
jgi:xylan 1,4-beta-xylosidase